MRLDNNDGNLFFKLYLSLLDFTNKKYNILPNISIPRTPAGLDVNILLPIRDKLWENTETIDEFVSSGLEEINHREKEILSSWKRRIIGKFIIIKNLKKHSVFVDYNDDENVYGVLGVLGTIEDMIPTYTLPSLVNAVLLPFEGRIVHDSIILSYSLSFGKSYRTHMNSRYQEVKKNIGIITSL